MSDLMEYAQRGNAFRLGRFRLRRWGTAEGTDRLLLGRVDRLGGMANVAEVFWGSVVVDTEKRWYGPHWKPGNALCFVWGRKCRYVTVHMSNDDGCTSRPAGSAS